MVAKKQQSAIEFLTTYGWAILVIAIMISFLYFFVLAPPNVVPTQCTTSSELHCEDIVFGANQLLSKTVLFLTNAQLYPIENPSVSINVSGVGVGSGSCTPNYVLPGGAIICNVTFSKPLHYGSLVDGKIILDGNLCTNLATNGCTSPQSQAYQGNFNAHVVPILSQTGLNVTMVARGPFLADGSLYKITAIVKLLGYPLQGATVNFTVVNNHGVLSQQYVTTGSDGNATTYVSSTTSGNTTINATFGGHTNTTTITFLKPVYATFSMNQPNTGYPVVTVGGVSFSNLPIKVAFAPNSIVSYSFQSIVQDTSGDRYAFSSVANSCSSANTQSGTISMINNCSVVATYTPQYYLTAFASPSNGGSVSPASNWYNTGTLVQETASPSANYQFNSWIINPSSAGSSTTSSVTLNVSTPVSAEAVFQTTTSTSTSTTTSTSTSTTTSTSTSTSTTTSTSTSTTVTTLTTSTSTTSTSTSTSTTITTVTTSVTTATTSVTTSSTTVTTSVTTVTTSVTSTVTSTSTTVTTIQTIQGCYYSGTCTGITFTACPSGEVCGNGAALCGGPDSCCFHTCQSTTTTTSTSTATTTASCSGTCCVNPSAPAYGTCGTTTCPC